MNLYCKHQIANNDTYRSRYEEIDWSSDIRTIEVQGTRYACDCCGNVIHYKRDKCPTCGKELRVVDSG